MLNVVVTLLTHPPHSDISGLKLNEKKSKRTFVSVSILATVA